MVYQMVHWHAKQQMVIYFQNDDCNNMKKFTYLLIFLACIISFATKAGDSRGGAFAWGIQKGRNISNNIELINGYMRSINPAGMKERGTLNEQYTLILILKE